MKISAEVCVRNNECLSVKVESLSEKKGKRASSCDKESQTVWRLSSFERTVGGERASSPGDLV